MSGFRRVQSHRGTSRRLSVLAALALTACPAIPFVIPAVLEFARNLLVTTNTNYGSRYSQDVNNMLVRLTQSYMPPPPIPVGMAGQPGMPGQPGMYGQPGQPGMTYPGQALPPGMSQPGGWDPNNPYGSAWPGQSTQPGMVFPGQGMPNYPGQSIPPNPWPAQPPQTGMIYPGQSVPSYPSQSYPSQSYPSQPAYPSPPGYQSQSPYPTQPGYPAQPAYPPQPSYPSQPGSISPGYPGQPNSYPAQPNLQFPTSPSSPPGIPGQFHTPQMVPRTPSADMAPGTGPSLGTPVPPVSGQPTVQPPAMPSPSASLPIEPPALDVALLRQVNTPSGKQIVLFKDGEVLKDGRGDPQAGDKFKIVFRSNCNCYVYVIAVDGSGWVQWVFPKKEAIAIPVIKDQEYSLPEGPYWFSLDQYRGVETIFLVASLQRRVDLEETLVQFAGRERPATMAPAQVEVPPIIPDGFGKTAAGKALAVSAGPGQSQQVTPVTYLANSLSEDLRVTRWFKHE